MKGAIEARAEARARGKALPALVSIEGKILFVCFSNCVPSFF